jgi:hypothetical protein
MILDIWSLRSFGELPNLASLRSFISMSSSDIPADLSETAKLKLVDSKNERLLALCPPAESTTLDFVRAFLRSAERKNETDVNNPAVLVLHALTKAYPCYEPTAAQ